jgi:hypothetical protein
MAKRPSFDALKKTKPAAAAAPAVERPASAEPKAPARIQTSVRLEPGLWAELNDLATRKRLDTGQRVTVHDLLLEGVRLVLAVNGIKTPEQQEP